MRLRVQRRSARAGDGLSPASAALDRRSALHSARWGCRRPTVSIFHPSDRPFAVNCHHNLNYFRILEFELIKSTGWNPPQSRGGGSRPTTIRIPSKLIIRQLIWCLSNPSSLLGSIRMRTNSSRRLSANLPAVWGTGDGAGGPSSSPRPKWRHPPRRRRVTRPPKRSPSQVARPVRYPTTTARENSNSNQLLNIYYSS